MAARRNLLDETRRSDGAMPSDRRYTGQPESATGLYYYGARWYDPAIAQFVSPDTIVPDESSFLDYNRYLYAKGNPLVYNDPSGHQASCMMGQDGSWNCADNAVPGIKTLQIDVAKVPEKAEPTNPTEMLNFLIGLAFVAYAPFDMLLSASPGVVAENPICADGDCTNEIRQTADFSRIIDSSTLAQELGLKNFTKYNYREGLLRYTGMSKVEAQGLEAHHVLPQEFVDRFRDLNININIHDPRFLSWVDAESHRAWSSAYNEEWRKFLDTKPDAAKVLQMAEIMAKEYGFELSFK